MNSLLDIEITRLDDEWLRQPKIYFENAEKLADKRFEVESLKNQLEVAESELEKVYARLDNSVRNDPASFMGSNKITETAIKNTILLHPSYDAAKQECNKIKLQLLEAKHEMDVLSALVEALNHKKSSLENLVKLHSQNYFSTPRVEDDGYSQEVTQIIQKRKANEKVRNFRKEKQQ